MKSTKFLFALCCATFHSLFAAQIPKEEKSAQGDGVVRSPSSTISFDAGIIDRLRSQNYKVSKAATHALTELVKVAPECHTEVLPLLIPLLKDQDWWVRSTATCGLGVIVKAAPNLCTAIFALFPDLLKDQSADVRFAAADALVDIVAAVPKLGRKVCALLFSLLTDEDAHGLEAVTYALGRLAPLVPELHVPTQMLPLLTPLLKSEAASIRRHAAYGLGMVVRGAPELGTKVFKLLMPLLHDRYVRETTTNALVRVVESAPEFSTEVFLTLTPLLKDNDSGVRVTVMHQLEKLLKISPTHTEVFVHLVKSLANDEADEVRVQARLTMYRLRVPIDSDDCLYQHGPFDNSKNEAQATTPDASSQVYKIITNAYTTLNTWFTKPSPSLQKDKVD